MQFDLKEEAKDNLEITPISKLFMVRASTSWSLMEHLMCGPEDCRHGSISDF